MKDNLDILHAKMIIYVDVTEKKKSFLFTKYINMSVFSKFTYNDVKYWIILITFWVDFILPIWVLHLKSFVSPILSNLINYINPL